MYIEKKLRNIQMEDSEASGSGDRGSSSGSGSKSRRTLGTKKITSMLYTSYILYKYF